MKFGVREICDVVFKAKSKVKIGSMIANPGQPVLYIDSAKTSTIEGAATTVYATGGRGNTRLIAWEGEKTLTFTVEDALLSPVGFAILSGAGLLKGKGTEKVHVHATTKAQVIEGVVDLSSVLKANEEIDADNIFVIALDDHDSFDKVLKATVANQKITIDEAENVADGTTVFVDYYVCKDSAKVSELQIDAANFAGSYYVEASTLFRREGDNVDMPAEITFPNVKIQSNFTFNMASTGDPSTFTFTMDALPDYTKFDKTKKVLCAIQIVEDQPEDDDLFSAKTVFPCEKTATEDGE